MALARPAVEFREHDGRRGPVPSGRDRMLRASDLRLTALCVAAVLAETLLLVRLNAGSVLALAPQVAAPAPWGVFHDERWLLAYAGSWPALVLGIVAVVAGRGVLTGVMVKAAWPRSAAPLSWRKAVLRGCESTAVAAVLLSPCASLLIAFALAPISDLWLAAIPSAIGIAIFVHHGPVDCWWLRHPRLRSVGWLLLSYLELTVAGAALISAPREWTPFIAVAAGLADAVAWRGLVRALARPAKLRWAPVGPIGLGGVVLITVLAVTAAATPSNSGSSPPRPPSGASAPAPAVPGQKAATHHVLLVSGYGVHWDGNAPSLGPGFDAREFSYRGITRSGKPLAYGSAATQQPLPVLLSKFRIQVTNLALASGHNIDIVGESEGSLLATIYLLTTPHPPVNNVVLLSPLVRPARASYPGPGRDGAGLGAAWELRGIANATQALTPVQVSPDSAFIQSLAEHADALSNIFGCPVNGVRQLAIVPLADAVGIPPGALSTVPHEAIAALHGTLLVNPGVRYDIVQYLNGAAAPSTRNNSVETVAAAASAAWQAPAQHLHSEPPGDVGCAHAIEALRSWLG